MAQTSVVENLGQLKDFFRKGYLIFTDDSDNLGIDGHLHEVGLTVDMEKAMTVYLPNAWYLKGRDGFIRYHPVTAEMPFQEIAAEGLITRIDFRGGQPPLVYDVCKTILDHGFRVGLPGLEGFIEDIAVFKKEKELYLREKVIARCTL
ncbi:hypothetical protein HZC30_05230 [Candidatus Woesearchaeota archaeon]|nr:hypothetical protein [Candidatus Woesearchaeota archaeon]